MLLLVNFNLFRVFQVEMMQTQLYNIHLTPKKCFNPEVKTTKTIISINTKQFHIKLFNEKFLSKFNFKTKKLDICQIPLHKIIFCNIFRSS